jgi:hypothetical protein
MTDQVSPVYKGIRKKDKGFVDVTKGVDIVQGSTLLVPRMGEACRRAPR